MKYVLTFSRTKQPAQYESVKVEYTQEFDEDTPREIAFDDVRDFVYAKLEKEMALAKIGAEIDIPSTPIKEQLPTAKEKAIPAAQEQIPLGKEQSKFPNLDAYPWMAFKEKRNARPDEPGWIFSNTKGLEGLTAALKEEGAIFVTIGDHEFLCKLSGKDDIFVNRSLKEKK